VSARLFLRAFFFATALPYGLSNDSSKIRFPFFGVWFPRGGWLAYLCLFAGQNAAAHAANLAFGELLNHYAAHKEKGDKKASSHSSFLFSSQKPLLLDRNLMGENKENGFFIQLMQLPHFFIKSKTLFWNPLHFRMLLKLESRVALSDNLTFMQINGPSE
jgi:hypothetical protein